jgi:acyl-CoA thioester hydrolase
MAEAAPTDRVPPFGFSCRVEVADTDLGAVVYYGRYTHFIDRAAIAYRRHLGIPPLGPPGHLFVVRSLAIDYRAPARFDDEVETFVRVRELGRTSHTVDARLERRGDGAAERALLADARLVVVGLAEYGGRPSRLPSWMRQAIATFEGIPPGRG